MTRAEIEGLLENEFSSTGPLSRITLDFDEAEEISGKARQVTHQLLAVMAENERLRGLPFTAYCEGYIAAGDKGKTTTDGKTAKAAPPYREKAKGRTP